MHVSRMPENTSLPVNYRLQPSDFVKQPVECLDDSDCRIYYLHFGKSGGSGLENIFFKVFPPYMDSYCNGNILRRFNETTSRYCTAKFSSYQVSGADFGNIIIPTCMREKGLRAILLVSFREPIQRGLSYIHQICSKNFRFRNRVTRQACTRCSYEQDTSFWDTKVKLFNQEYKELLNVTNTRSKIDNATVLTVDMMDLTSLYRAVLHATGHKAFRQTLKKANAESTHRCNFGHIDVNLVSNPTCFEDLLQVRMSIAISHSESTHNK